jgi:hypothetical protein
LRHAVYGASPVCTDVSANSSFVLRLTSVRMDALRLRLPSWKYLLAEYLREELFQIVPLKRLLQSWTILVRRT